ncbi:D-psicose/D-tagatose/L-ribulose 3-epimerase [Rhizobium sp. RU35A]|nr:D-psicose/D-tagatose/L-ribulose 3-epimerase [Rhizobium sp. RU35A]
MTVQGFGIHASIWTMDWNRQNAEHAITAAAAHGLAFIEIPLVDMTAINAAHSRTLLEAHGVRGVCSLVLPQAAWASVNPEAAAEHLCHALDLAAAMGCEALSGVTFGGTNERTGFPPTAAEYDNLARALDVAGRHARAKGLLLGIEPVNRYENHLLNTARQAVDLIERIGLDTLFVHLDTFHMAIEERGFANGILDARDHLKYMHMSESHRGTPGDGNVDWDAIFSALAAIGFAGGLAVESFAGMPARMAGDISLWRPVSEGPEAVLGRGLAFLRDKAAQYGLSFAASATPVGEEDLHVRRA